MKQLRFSLCIIFLLFFSSTVFSQTYVSGYYSGSMTAEGSPYIITDSLVVKSELHIDRGVIIMFRYHPEPEKKSYLKADGGNIYAVFTGDGEEEIIFTSERDDSYGDFNGDGSATVPKSGDWGYVQLNSYHTGIFDSGFMATTFKYGGGRNPDTISNPDFYPMFDMRKSNSFDFGTFMVDNCSFLHSKGSGVRLGVASMSNCTIINCTNGVLVSSPEGSIRFTSITECKNFPIVIDGFEILREYNVITNPAKLFASFNNNIISNNGLDYIALGGEIKTTSDSDAGLSGNTKLNLQHYSIPYYIYKPLEIQSVDLQIDGGSQFKFKYFADNSSKPYISCDALSSLTVSSTGNEGYRTIFTSEFEHKYDAEFYSGDDRDPLPGDWGYIEGYDLSLDNCVFSYGGLYTNRETGARDAASSAMIRVHVNEDTRHSCHILNSSFNNCYAHGVIFDYKADPVGYETEISNNSFLLNKAAYGVKVLSESIVPSTEVNALNNFWYGKLGPYHASFNVTGNGCRVSDHVNFSPFEKESEDLLELFSSGIIGTVKNLEGDLLSGAMIRMPGKREKVVYSKTDGSYYIPNVYAGYGYEMETYKAKHFDTTLVNIEVFPDTTQRIDVVLRARTIDYLVDTITFKVNPRISEVQVGGTAYRYYKIIDRKTHDPVYGAEVFVAGLVDTFYTNYKGIVTIPFPWDKVGSAGTSKRYYISKVGIETLEYPPELQMPFTVEVQPREYEKIWGGNLWLKEGISIVQLKQEVGASIGLQVEDHGSGEAPSNLILERGFKAGGGVNLSASAKATLGPVKAGAEAGVELNASAYMQDRFLFDYESKGGDYALAKFIVLAGSAFQYLDSPLHRYLSCALLNELPYVEDAHYSNSIGLNIYGQGTAEASLGLTLKESDGKESPIGAELKGSAESVGNIDFLFTSYADSDQLDFKLSRTAEITIGANAGVGIDIAKLLGGGDEKEKDDKNKPSNSNNSGGDDKKDDNEFEIEVPELLSLGVSGGIKYGASIEAVRNIPSPYTSLGFMYGYKYGAGVQVTPFFGAGVGQDREFNVSINLHDAFLKSILDNHVALAKAIGSGDMSDLNLDLTSLAGADIFTAPLDVFANMQKVNAYLFPPVPYEKSVTDLVDEGDFVVEISFGLGPVKANFGGGIEYTESNDYLLKTGVFFDWGLYPLQEYPYVADNDDYDVGVILQDILTESGSYMWEAIKDQLIPPIFKKIPIWPFTLLKGSGPYVIPAGPDSRTSVLTVDNLSVQDSVWSYYWDWYGTEGVSRKKSAMSAKRLAVLDHMRELAVEVHKLDYGIGGFYQFEPNGTVISDSAVLTINYSDEELDLLLSDGTEYHVDENDLRMYVEDKSNSQWVYVGGVVDPINNTVTARIDSLGTFTLAPFIPCGDVELTLSSDTISVENGNSVQVSTNEIYYNMGSRIEDGEEFNVLVSKGTVVEADVNPEMEGLQLAAQGGKVHFTFMSDSISGIAYLKVESVKGGAAGIEDVVIDEKVQPSAPVLILAELSDYAVNLQWNPSEEIDVSSYLVNYGTKSGGPYNGTASVFGEDSPVVLRAVTSTSLEGLYKDSTYYFTVCAVDRAGNVSDLSNEMTLSTSFNHRPVVYSRVFLIEPILEMGTVIDTMWASDEDKDQTLSFFFTEENSCTAFDLDSETGIITVKDPSQLDYWITGIDTLTLKIGVKDDGPGELSNSCTVLMVLDVHNGERKYLTDDEEWFKAYPNPATDMVTISVSKNINADESHLDLVSLQGKLVKRIRLSEYSFTDTFDLSLEGCDPGIYLIQLRTDKGKGVQRIVVL